MPLKQYEIRLTSIALNNFLLLHCLNDFTYFIENNFTGKNLGHYDFFCTKIKIVYYKWHVTSFVMHSKKEKYLPYQKGSHKSLCFLFPSAGSLIYSNFGKSHYLPLMFM